MLIFLLYNLELAASFVQNLKKNVFVLTKHLLFEINIVMSIFTQNGVVVVYEERRGWGIYRQVRKKLQIPGGVPGGVVTRRIKPCISGSQFSMNGFQFTLKDT